MPIEVKPEIKINITPRAKEYLERTGSKELYIELVEIKQCCIPLAAPPDVRKGRPAKPENFLKLEADGFTVYYDRSLIRRPEITIDVQGFGIFKGLVITDWEIRF